MLWVIAYEVINRRVTWNNDWCILVLRKNTPVFTGSELLVARPSPTLHDFVEPSDIMQEIKIVLNLPTIRGYIFTGISFREVEVQKYSHRSTALRHSTTPSSIFKIYFANTRQILFPPKFFKFCWPTLQNFEFQKIL